jgi:hypothetical protein
MVSSLSSLGCLSLTLCVETLTVFTIELCFEWSCASTCPFKLNGKAGMNVEFVTDIDKLSKHKGLGKYISELIFTGEKTDLEIPRCNFVPNKMTVNVYVFCMGMKHWIRYEICRIYIITPKNRTLRLRNTIS